MLWKAGGHIITAVGIRISEPKMELGCSRAFMNGEHTVVHGHINGLLPITDEICKISI